MQEEESWKSFCSYSYYCFVLNLHKMEYFDYVSDLRLLCCKSCKYMVTKGRIQAHLRSKPHVLVKKEIDKVKLWAGALDLINNNEEILALPPIPDNNMPIEALGKPKSDGF